jgi:hypothetical protein
VIGFAPQWVALAVRENGSDEMRTELVPYGSIARVTIGLEESQLREADFVVRPQATVKQFADFSDPTALIASGERAAEETLPQIAAVLERHRSLFVRPVASMRRDTATTCRPTREGI